VDEFVIIRFTPVWQEEFSRVRGFMVNPQSYDAIVIGSGIGGLTAASLLAKKGRKVLLLEKEKQAGGYVVSFKRGERIFDATGAFVGGCQDGGEFHGILHEIGAEKEVEFIPVRRIENIYPGFKVSFQGGGYGSYTDALLSLFPEEEKGLEAYLRLVKKIGEEIRSYAQMTGLKKVFFPFYFWNLVRYHRASHRMILDRFFSGEEIKMALHSLPATEPPSRLSFLFVATVINKALIEGVYYPRGGMGRVSQAFLHSFLRSGGEIRLQAEVEQILVENGKAGGVQTRDGRRFHGSLVVSDINPNLLGRMLPRDCQRPFVRKWETLDYSLSCFILYLATDLDLERMGLPYFTYLRSLSDVEEEGRMMRRGEVPGSPTLILSIPTLLDPSPAPSGQHLVKVLVPIPQSYRATWGDGDPDAYSRIKEEFSRTVLEHVESRVIPGLRSHLLFCEAATPLTLERYTGNESGAMYGLASTPSQIGNSRPPCHTAIPGLFQVGHYTRPSHGIVGTSLSGLFAVRRILAAHSFPLL
jgi:prolycopene isomerase